MRPDYITYCVVDGEDINVAHVWIDSSPVEPDVNWHGSFEVTSVEVKGVEVMPRMSKGEITDLEERLYQEECDAAEDWRY